MDEKERELYFLREKSIKDEISALANAEEKGIQIGIEQGIEQARVIFRLYISGKSEEDIARETGETIEMIHKVLKG